MAATGSKGNAGGNAGNADGNANNPNENSTNTLSPEAKAVQEANLEKMEALLKQSAQGIHVLFDNESIARALADVTDDKDFFDFDKMKRVQDVMTELIARKSYYDKLDFIQTLDQDSYDMLIRTYFHIVENTVRAASDFAH